MRQKSYPILFFKGGIQMKYPIEQQLLPITQKKLISASLIIAHESGNAKNSGPLSLENEVAYMKRQAQANGAFTSHWVGGGGRIIQIAQSGKMQYGAGKNANPHAYAQVELARTSNLDWFQKDYQAYVWLLQKLAAEAGIPNTLNSGTTLSSKGIKTHHWISSNLGGTNHTDPDAYLLQQNISLEQFSKDLAFTDQTTPIPIPNSSEPHHLYHSVLKGDSLWGIAKKYHTTLTWLKMINNLSSETILIGQRLIISIEQPKAAAPSQIELIKLVQKKLAIKQDGLFGSVTKQVLIKLVQKEVGSKIDGFWGPKTASKMRILKSGSTGWDVYAVQVFLLSKKNYLMYNPDNFFGPKTVQAVKKFQTTYDLLPDGIVGPKTYQKLFS